MDTLEEQFYAVAAQEVATKNTSPGVMAKAFADANGDEKKAIAKYIRLRVSQQKEAHKAAVAQAARHESQRRKKQSKVDRIIAKENERLLKHPPKLGDV